MCAWSEPSPPPAAAGAAAGAAAAGAASSTVGPPAAAPRRPARRRRGRAAEFADCVNVELARLDAADRLQEGARLPDLHSGRPLRAALLRPVDLAVDVHLHHLHAVGLVILLEQTGEHDERAHAPQVGDTYFTSATPGIPFIFSREPAAGAASTDTSLGPGTTAVAADTAASSPSSCRRAAPPGSRGCSRRAAAPPPSPPCSPTPPP